MPKTRWTAPEVSPWRRRGLTIPPDSFQAWVKLATWEFSMGVLVYMLVAFGTQLVASAPHSVVTVYDFGNCYAPPPVALPCERVAYRVGSLNAVLNLWCGLLLLGAAAWLMWDLWSAAAPRPITDDFLKLLDDSFARDWRKPRTWPWTRMAWAYGFACAGISLAVGVSLLMLALSGPSRAKQPIPRIETSQQFRATR